MADELAAGDTTTPATIVETPDLWELEDVGRVRATPEEVARDLAADFDTPAPPMPDADGDTVEAPAKPAEDHQDHDSLDEEPEDGDPPAPKVEEPKPPKENKRSIDGRIKTKQAELGRIAAEVRAETARLARLRAEAAVATEPAKADDQAPKPAAAPDADALKKPVWAEFEAADKSWDDFLAAQDAYADAKIAAIEAKLDQKLQATEQQRVERDAEVRVDAVFTARMDAAKAAHEDFDVAVDGWDEVPVVPFLRDAVKWHPKGAEMYYQIGKQPEVAAVLGSLTYTAEMMDAVMASPDPTAMLVHLAENPAEYERLVQLPARQALVAFGALDARLQAASSSAPVAPSRVDGSQKRAVPVSKATPPIRPVAGGSRPTSTTDDPDDMDFGPDYVRTMNARERGSSV